MSSTCVRPGTWPCHQGWLGPVAPVPRSPGLELPALSFAPGFSTGYSPWPHLRPDSPARPPPQPTSPPTNFRLHPHQSLSPPVTPIPLSSRAAPTQQLFRSIITAQPASLSRPLEDCAGCPALAGVRNLRLDDPSAGCSDLHRNFGVRSIWARRAAAARRAGSLERGCTGRTVRRAEWQALAECVAPGGDHAATGRVHGRCLKLRVRRPWLVRRARTRTRRAGSHPPRSPIPASARPTPRPDQRPHRAGP